MKAKYAFTTLHIKDLDRSLAFYRDIVGMKIISESVIPMPSGSPHVINVLQSPEGACIELVAADDFELEKQEQENFSLAFEVDDAEAIMEAIGSECHMSIEPAPGKKFYFTEDPDGYPLNLIETK